MRHTIRFLFSVVFFVGLTVLPSCGEPAETGLSAEVRAALDTFLEADNAGKEPADFATEARGKVRIAEGDGLTVIASAPDGKTYVLRREESAEIDFLLPKTFEHATIIYADRSTIILNHEDKYHYVLSLDQQPDLPLIPEAEYVVFTGNGLIRFGD